MGEAEIHGEIAVGECRSSLQARGLPDTELQSLPSMASRQRQLGPGSGHPGEVHSGRSSRQGCASEREGEVEGWVAQAQVPLRLPL